MVRKSMSRRVLIYRLGSLGDTVVALPAFHMVAKAFPDAERRLLTNFPVNAKAAAAEVILAPSGLIHGFVAYPVATRNPFQLLGLWWKLLLWRPQVVVHLGSARGATAARRDVMFFRLCGVRRQIGAAVTEEMQQNLPQPETETLEPECERLVRNLKALGSCDLQSSEMWDLCLTEAERSKASEVLLPASDRSTIAASVGTKLQANDWGQANWLALFSELARRNPAAALVLIGSTDERDACDELATCWRAAAGIGSVAINLCGDLAPRESAACLALANLFLGHDSGPMHLAASVGTPVVAIFSARNLPRIWFPYGGKHKVIYHEVDCMGCRLETCIVEQKRCLRSITVDEVLSAVDASQALGRSKMK